MSIKNSEHNSTDRVLFYPGIQRSLLNSIKSKKGLRRKAFASILGLNENTLKNYLREARLIPASLVLCLYSIDAEETLKHLLFVREIRKKEWGQVLGGRTAQQTLMKKYGYNFISQFSLKGALTFVKNLREKNQEVIPTETDERLCELLGVMFGDGCIFASCSGKRFRKFVYISGHAVNDFAYLSEYISRLFKELFHREVRVRKEKGKLTINIGFTSEAIFDFFEKLGMPSGEKKNRLNIPAWLLNSPPDLKKAFLRGLFDTDGGICLRSGNRVHFVTATQLFAKQVSELLSSFGFNPKTYAHKDGSYTLCLNGTQQVEKWISEIGFININHYSKYLYWKRFGCCPTEKEMPLSQRLEKLGLGSY